MRPSDSGVGRFIACSLASAFAAGVLHVLLGWVWTVGGGAVGGWCIDRRGWLVGGIGGAVAWSAFAAWSLIVDARAVSEMARVVGSLLGGLPPVATVAVTVLVGSLLGAAGGMLGGAVRNILRPVRR